MLNLLAVTDHTPGNRIWICLTALQTVTSACSVTAYLPYHTVCWLQGRYVCGQSVTAIHNSIMTSFCVLLMQCVAYIQKCPLLHDIICFEYTRVSEHCSHRYHAIRVPIMISETPWAKYGQLVVYVLVLIYIYEIWYIYIYTQGILFSDPNNAACKRTTDFCGHKLFMD